MAPILRRLAVLLVCLLPVNVTVAFAAVNATVRLTVLRVTDVNNDDDSTSQADFFIAGVFSYATGAPYSFNNQDNRIEGEKEIHPNWQFEFEVPVSAANASLGLRVYDYDAGLNGGDDSVIADSLNIELASCVIKLGSDPNVNNTCGRDFTIRGSDEIVVRIEVNLPPSAPGLRVKCLQDPLLPMPGDIVRIRAQALDGALNPKIVDSFAIEVNDTRRQLGRNVAEVQDQFTMQGNRFRLKCVAATSSSGDAKLSDLTTLPDDSEIADTWTREVRVANPEEHASLIAGPASSKAAVDIFVMPISYLGPRATPNTAVSRDPAFQSDLRDSLGVPPFAVFVQPTLQNGFYNNSFVLSHQNRINFWILHRQPVLLLQLLPASNLACLNMAPPEDWDDFPQAETGWIYWQQGPAPSLPNRDCAIEAMRYFTAQNNDGSIAVHETGHSPFGLADEYNGNQYANYDQGPGFEEPNIFSNLTACTRDAATFGAPSSDCRVIMTQETTADATKVWYTHDPVATSDVMGNQQITFNRLDIRRWNRLIKKCNDPKVGC